MITIVVQNAIFEVQRQRMPISRYLPVMAESHRQLKRQQIVSKSGPNIARFMSDYTIVDPQANQNSQGDKQIDQEGAYCRCGKITLGTYTL